MALIDKKTAITMIQEERKISWEELRAYEDEYRQGVDDGFAYAMQVIDEDVPIIGERQMNNKVHLCDSCRKVFPECESTANDIFFGNGVGNDNVCACPHYESKERKKAEWIPVEDDIPYGVLVECSECGQRIIINDALEHNFCSNCGADMRGEADE